ncbi:MAG: SMI1/KNR4 family protein [Methanobrevibacter sp.]|nr:SMI1/KNR4 family protein [Methanobrevibacter sp.]
MKYKDFIQEYELARLKNPKLFSIGNDDIADAETVQKYQEYYGVSFAKSFVDFVGEIGGGYFGYILILSLDDNGVFNIKSKFTKEMIEGMDIFPVIDLETGDYIGYKIKNKTCTESLVVLNHDGKIKKELDVGFYELIVQLGIYNDISLLSM